MSSKEPRTIKFQPMDKEEGLAARLRGYRPRNEWGDPEHHIICNEAAAEIERLMEENAELRNELYRRGAEADGDWLTEREKVW